MERRTLALTSPLSSDQLRILGLYKEVGIKLDNKTFLAIWKLVNLGIPPNVIVDLLRDIARHQIEPEATFV